MLLDRLKEKNYDIIGYPRLVRLNPNIPWKTRGNGAVSFQIKNGERKEIKKLLEEFFKKYARIEDKLTNPGFVILDKPPSYKIYEKTVKEIVTLKETKDLLKSLNAEYKGYKNCRGLIGATASIAWSPKYDKTLELITYRQEKKWGTKRTVDYKTTIDIDKRFPSTFDNYDYKNKHNRLVPNSPCPILYGIRGENAVDLAKALSIIKSEKVSFYKIFETNQGTDDHLQKRKIKDIKSFESVIIKGTICKSPHTIRGGHVIFTIKDSTGKIDCAAYEPTKEFRATIRRLDKGDKVEVYGGVRQKPLTVNLEKIKIINLGNKLEKIENPVCPNCGKHMKSKGKGQGYKCIKCGKKSNSPKLKKRNRDIKIGFYEVPVCARRHLSKPLKRMKP